MTIRWFIRLVCVSALASGCDTARSDLENQRSSLETADSPTPIDESGEETAARLTGGGGSFFWYDRPPAGYGFFKIQTSSFACAGRIQAANGAAVASAWYDAIYPSYGSPAWTGAPSDAVFAWLHGRDGTWHHITILHCRGSGLVVSLDVW